jgi:hypothetical protein
VLHVIPPKCERIIRAHTEDFTEKTLRTIQEHMARAQDLGDTHR